MKNQIDIVKDIADGMIGIGGIPSNEEFYAEFDMRVKTALRIHDVSNWVAYDWNDISSRPPKYGKYFVHRKDGKVHWETWNGSGWAYNEKVITHWQEVKPPYC